MDHIHPLRAYRNARGLSRDDLAALLGVSKPTVWRWEAGKRKVDEELLPAVSEKTGISKADLRPDLAELLKQPEAAE